MFLTILSLSSLYTFLSFPCAWNQAPEVSKPVRRHRNRTYLDRERKERKKGKERKEEEVKN